MNVKPWSLRKFVQNFHPEPVRAAALAYLESIDVDLEPDTDPVTRAGYETLSEVAHNGDAYDNDASPPALRAVVAAWAELRDTLQGEILGVLGNAGRPMMVSAFVIWGGDSARNSHTIFMLFAMSRTDELWFVDMEDDSGLFGLPEHYQPKGVDEAWDQIALSAEDYPVKEPVYDDGSVQAELGLEVAGG